MVNTISANQLWSWKELEDLFKTERNKFIIAITEEVFQEQFTCTINGTTTDQIDNIKPGEVINGNKVKHKVATSTSDGAVSFQPKDYIPYSDVK